MANTYATWNPSDKSTSISLSNGNLTAAVTNSTDWRAVRSTIGVSSGKWYWEISGTAASDGMPVAIANGSGALNSTPGDADSWYYYSANGHKQTNNVSSAYGATFTTGDVIGVALDMDGGTLTFYKNNVSQGTAFTGLTGTKYAEIWIFDTGFSATANFGASALTYSPPAGYNAGLYTPGAATTLPPRSLLGVGI